MLIVAAVLTGSLAGRAEFPWFEVDSIYDTRELYIRWAFWRDNPEFYTPGNGEYYGLNGCRDSITIDPTRAMLVVAHIIPWTRDDFRQKSIIEWRMRSAFRVNHKTYRLEFKGEKHLGKMRPDTKAMLLELGFQQIAIIDSFLAHGYTPYNLTERLNKENRYLSLPAPFNVLFFGCDSYNWVFEGIMLAANYRAFCHPTWETFPIRDPDYPGKYKPRSLPSYITPQQYADTLNISLGTLYYALCPCFAIELRHYHEPTSYMSTYWPPEESLIKWMP